MLLFFRDGNERRKLELELLDVHKELADSRQKVQVCWQKSLLLLIVLS